MSATATATAVKTSFSAKLANLKAGLRPAIEVAYKGALKDHADMNRVTIEVKDADLIASSYGGRLAITISISDMTDDKLGYVSKGDGKFTVNAIDLERCLSSFPESETINVTVNGNEVVMALDGDAAEVQALPIMTGDVTMPVLAKSFEKEVTIQRGVFLDGINEVIWATGNEDHKEQYHHCRLIADKDQAIFAAGTGGRFKTWTVTGPKFISTDTENTFFFNRDQTPAVQSILSAVTDESIVIKQADRKGEAPDQIVIETNSFKLMFVGFDPNMKYPNIDKPISEPRPFWVKTTVGDWEYAVKGVMATYNEDVKKDNDTHESDLQPVLEKDHILLTAKTGLRSQRKVPILGKCGNWKEQPEDLEFHCSSKYIAEIFQKCPKEDKVTIEYHDVNERPIFVISEEATNALGLKTQYLLFFASMKK